MWDHAKIASIFILFVLSVLSGIFSCVTVKCLVARFGKSNKFKRTISVMNCFAGGVFFATCILDIVPEARENMENAKNHWGWSTEYPLSELLLGVGFLMILTLEHGAHACYHSRNSENTHVGDKQTSVPNIPADEKTKIQTSVSYSSIKVNQKPEDYVTKSDSIIVGDFEDNSYFDDVTYKTYGTVDESIDKTCIRPYAISPDPRTKNDVEILFEDSDKIVVKQVPVTPRDDLVTTSVALQSLAEDSIKRTNLRGFVLLTALSLHMIFDGLSLGLLKQTSNVWNLLLALSLHKALVFYTIGLQTLELLKCLRKTIFVVCVFALVSPVGIIIGESINSLSEQSTQDSASAILQGIASGTFIYVTFFEIFQREFEASGHDLLKVFATIIGFAVIGGFRLLGHEEDDG